MKKTFTDYLEAKQPIKSDLEKFIDSKIVEGMKIFSPETTSNTTSKNIANEIIKWLMKNYDITKKQR